MNPPDLSHMTKTIEEKEICYVCLTDWNSKNGKCKKCGCEVKVKYGIWRKHRLQNEQSKDMSRQEITKTCKEFGITRKQYRRIERRARRNFKNKTGRKAVR